MFKQVFSVAALALLAMSLNVSTPAQAEELSSDSLVIAQADEAGESDAVPVDEGDEMPLPDDGGGEDGDDTGGEDTGSDE